MPGSLTRSTLHGARSPTARKWLMGGVAAAGLLGGAALVSHYLMDGLVTAKPASEPVSAAQRLAEEQCVEAAFLFHDVRWAAACMVLAEQDDARREACLDDPAITANPQLGKNYCAKTFPLRDGSPDCDLPDPRAASLNALLGDAERKCKAEASAASPR